MTPRSPLPAPSSQCYLVTGAAGFIASKVCEFLLAEGHTVVGVDNLNDYYDVRLKDYRLARLLDVSWPLPGADAKRSVFAAGLSDAGCLLSGSDPNNQQPLSNNAGTFTFHPLDIENLAALDEVFRAHNFTAVFNLAARAGVRYSMENPHVYLSTNTLGTLNILECMRKYGVKKHVLASTSSLYAGCAMPFTEDLPVNTPLSPYAATKKGAELMAYSYHKLYGLDSTVVRYFTVFGPAGRPDMSIFRFIKWIDEGTPMELFGDGSQSRDFTYVDDVARGTILAGRLLGGRITDDSPVGGLRFPIPGYDEVRQHGDGATAGRAPELGGGVTASGNPEGESGYNIVNIGGGRNPISLNTVIAYIEKAFGKQALYDRKPFHIADIKETWADITKANRLLGWQPQISPEEGFRRSVEWYRENREWLKDIKL